MTKVATTQVNSTQGLELLARSGYAARGVVYLIVAFFAVQAARGSGDNVSTKGAVEQMMGEPYGQALLWALFVGLIGYAIWRMIQALSDTDNHGSDLKGLVIRAALVASGITHVVLAFFALSLVSSVDVGAGGGGSGGGGAGGDMLSRLLEFENSNLLIYAIALIPLGTGIAHLVKAWRAGFERYFECPEHVMRWVRPVSQVGLAARGIVFLIIAALLFMGGARYEPTAPPGLKEALDALQGMPFGSLLLLAIGLGLAAFAVYSFAEARWRRIDMREVTSSIQGGSARVGVVRQA
jgi:hypothetical protein